MVGTVARLTHFGDVTSSFTGRPAACGLGMPEHRRLSLPGLVDADAHYLYRDSALWLTVLRTACFVGSSVCGR